MSTVQLAFDRGSSATSPSSCSPSTSPTTSSSSRASAARRWPPRGSCTRTSSRSSTSASTSDTRAPLHRHGVHPGPLGRGDPARRTGARRPTTRSTIVAQACRGLDHAHRNGVVHRDVKPGNLLRSDEGGSSSPTSGSPRRPRSPPITQAGSVLGTAAYLAPEQARGEEAGPPSDLYALGVVAYQLLAGRLPYEAASLTELRSSSSASRRRARRASTPTSRPRWRAPSTRALALDPRDRYADAEEMADALERRRARGRPDADRRDVRSTAPRRRGCSTRHRPPPRARRPPPPGATRTAPAAEPRDEPAPRRRPGPPRRRAARRVAAAGAATRRSCPGGCSALVLAARRVVARRARRTTTVQDERDQAVQLREDVARQRRQDAVDETPAGSIDDNTQLERRRARPQLRTARRAARAQRRGAPRPSRPAVDRVAQRRHDAPT